MKFTAVFLAFVIAAVAAAPINVSDNNVGDIITVGVNANLDISNQVEQNIIGVILALLNNQSLTVGGQDGESPIPLPAKSKLEITPEMVETIKNLLTKN